MNKNRLLKLATLLEKDAKNKKGIKFDLGTWGETDDPGETLGVSCGTTACAMGLAALSGSFKRAGLEPKPIPTGDWLELGMKWKGRTVKPLLAARRLFDISEAEAGFLFLPSGYADRWCMSGAVGERVVAKRLRDLVAGKVAAPTDHLPR
jgi:hypothetical protein